jgi:hypothetical protein
MIRIAPIYQRMAKMARLNQIRQVIKPVPAIRPVTKLAIKVLSRDLRQHRPLHCSRTKPAITRKSLSNIHSHYSIRIILIQLHKVWIRY